MSAGEASPSSAGGGRRRARRVGVEPPGVLRDAALGHPELAAELGHGQREELLVGPALLWKSESPPPARRDARQARSVRRGAKRSPMAAPVSTMAPT